MDNVFITQSTFQNIVRQLDFDKIPIELLGNTIYDKAKIEYLDTRASKTVLSYKYLSDNPDMLSVYQKTAHSEHPDNHFLIKTTSHPKFHLFSDCENITHKFENMIIPKAIKNKGDAVIDEFRDYLLSEYGKFSSIRYKNQKETIINTINLKFNVTITANDLLIIDEANTGSKKAKDFSLAELEINISNFAEEYFDLCERYKDIFPAYTLKAFIHKKPEDIKFIPLNYFKTNQKEEFCRILKNFHDNIQLTTFEHLKQYYMVFFNPELKFKGRLLEQLGLKQCAKCTERSNK